MKNIDQANKLLLDTLETLVSIKKQITVLEQQEQLTSAIDNLEEIRSFIFDIKNDLNRRYS